jgi:FKBP-type peptidyl-prolyl cis-trans isomerase
MTRFIPALALSAIALCGFAEPAKPAAKAPDGRAFLQQNARAKDVVSLPGLQYKILQSGPADAPTVGGTDNITVNYELKLLDGTVIDSSFARGEANTFPLKQLIPGWEVAVRMMRPGDEWLIYVPPEMGYGANGKGPIPGNSVLVFRLQLISAEPAAGG